MVDQSLLRRAADREVTICFADLDGADGLWVPEERTVLVNRGLPEAKVAEVIEHELAHMMIDDQHADLDAGKEVLVGQPSGRRRETVALAAALGLVAVVGGVMYGIHTAGGPDKFERVAPNPNAPGLTASESGPSPSLSPSRVPGGGTVYVTVYPTATTTPGTTGPPFIPSTPSATATNLPPTRTATRSPTGPPDKPTNSPAPSPSQTSPTPTIVPTPDPTSPVPSPPDESAGGAGGGTGDEGGTGSGTGTGIGTGSDTVGADSTTAAGAPAAVPVGGTTAP